MTKYFLCKPKIHAACSVTTIILISLLCFIACSSKPDPRLSAINDLASSNPQAALDSLALIDASRLSGRDRHYYDFLTVKTNDKAYVIHTSDSLILDVIDYYKNEDDKALYTEVLYYGGRVYSDLGDLPTALTYFHRAMDELPDKERYTGLESRIVSQTGRLLNTLRLYEEAIPYVERSIEINKYNRDTLNLANNLKLLGSIHIRKGDNIEAQNYFIKALRLDSTLSSYDIAKSKMYMAEIKWNLGETDSALVLIRESIGKVKPIVSNYALSRGVYIYRDNGLYDSAFLIAKRLLDSPYPYEKDIALHFLLSPVARSFSSPDSLSRYVGQYVDILENSYNENETRLSVDRQSLYNYRLHEGKRIKAEQRARNLRNWILVFCIVLLACIFTILSLKIYNARTVIRLKNAIEIAASLRDRIRKYEEDNKESSAKSENNKSKEDSFRLSVTDEITLLREKLRSELLDLYKKGKTSPLPHFIFETEIYKNLQYHIEAKEIFREDNPDWKEVENLVLSVSPDFIKNLGILTGHTLTRYEMRTSMLIKLGFSPIEISILVGRAKNTISTRRLKMGEKMFGKGIETKIVDCIIRLL
ncbi:MAG: tetratricopeptide repeat protein [Muribaculaceae bacterium]|nr:tetratricopeptide repeat protein [Muribaculaceae bacterium]